MIVDEIIRTLREEVLETSILTLQMKKTGFGGKNMVINQELLDKEYNKVRQPYLHFMHQLLFNHLSNGYRSFGALKEHSKLKY